MLKVSIVIPNYNRYDLVHQTLFDIYNNTSTQLIHEVVVINNGCTQEESFTGLAWWMGNGMLPVRELRLTENVHFLRGSNIGMKDAQGDIVSLISNDVRVYKDFVKLCVDMIENDPKIMVGGRYLNWDTGWNCINNRIYPYLEGWLLCASKKAWEDFGYFDERFAPHDMEDVDVSTTAIKKGYSLISTPENFFHHLGGQSIGFNPEREQITITNKKKFAEKWTNGK